ARKNGLPVLYVTEDTTRAQPETLRRLFGTAIDEGATRVAVCDTVGHSTPDGARAVVGFVRRMLDDLNPKIGLDWHGHSDRGFGLINAIVAAVAGADRIHGCALGLGERVGNTHLDLLLVNFRLLGWIDTDLSKLREMGDVIAEGTGMAIPANYPVLGRDAFRTATGVHAAAVIKAKRKGDDWLANRVYSGVPAELFGCEQVRSPVAASGPGFELAANQRSDGRAHKRCLVPRPRSAAAMRQRLRAVAVAAGSATVCRLAAGHCRR
ncbi:MAG: hypothetical protein E6I88_00270, partial [Chloroflexi bacterium]